MARRLRIAYPGAIYHVTGRMIGSWRDQRDRLFRDDTDRKRFLDRLGQSVEDFDVRLYLFCLMNNHYHLLLETPRGNLSRFMLSLATGYTVYFNRRHKRHGHLFDGRYQSVPVEGDEYLLKLSRYIHHNPVSIQSWSRRPIQERTERLRTYRWSSYRGYAGLQPPSPFVDEEPILAMMAGGKRSRRKSYKQYVEEGLAGNDVELNQALKKRSLGIGDQNFRVFIERIRNQTLRDHRRSEDFSFRRSETPLKASKILKVVREELQVDAEELTRTRKGSWARAIAARMLQKLGNMSQREAAEKLGFGTGAAVSIQLKRLREAESNNRKLAKLVRKVERALKPE